LKPRKPSKRKGGWQHSPFLFFLAFVPEID